MTLTTKTIQVEIIPNPLLPPFWKSAKHAIAQHWGEDYEFRFVSRRVSLGCFVFRWSSLARQERCVVLSELIALREIAASDDAAQHWDDDRFAWGAGVCASASDLESWLAGLIWLCEHADLDDVRAGAAEDFVFALLVTEEMKRLDLHWCEVIPSGVTRDLYFPILRVLGSLDYPVPPSREWAWWMNE